MPGLWDNHVHFGGGEALIGENRNLLPLYLAHGVTTVRDAAGDLSPSVLEWRAQVAAGTLLGPTIYTSGPSSRASTRSGPATSRWAARPTCARRSTGCRRCASTS